MNTQDVKTQDVKSDTTSFGWGDITHRLAHGDIGSLPVLLGLILIAAIFQIANSNFLTPLNLTNLMVQITAVGTIAVGVVFVLLIGEIDLSVGAVSGLSAGIMAVLSVKTGLSAPLALGAGILTGVGIGLLQGFWTAKLHVPSFVVTLAGLLGWQGALLFVLGDTGTVNLTDPIIIGIANSRLPVWLGWLIGVCLVAGYAFSLFNEQQKRLKAGVQAEPMAGLIVRVIVFILSSVLAACGGILAGSRLYAVNQSSGGGDVLLNAIAAAVIGGTSLFGGRGSIWSALLGALVIGSIANGMDLLAFSAYIKFMVTGAVLLIAVTIDAYTRSRREQAGQS
jgi:D-xylose transport system permease protein